MTTGTIIFLTLIAAFILVLGAVIIYQYCDIKVSIDQSEISRCIESKGARKMIDKSVKESRDDIYRIYDNLGRRLMKRLDDLEKELITKRTNDVEKELNLKSGTIFKSSPSPESVTLKGVITPPSSLSDVELRKYCIEQTNKDQVYLRIEDAQRLYDYILNGNQRGKEVTNEH